jgi:hypothetical protein
MKKYNFTFLSGKTTSAVLDQLSQFPNYVDDEGAIIIDTDILKERGGVEAAAAALNVSQQEISEVDFLLLYN